MTKEGINKEEKAIFLGMMAVLNIDICAHFACPQEGCDDCPLTPVIEAHEHFIDVACRVPDKTEGVEK